MSPRVTAIALAVLVVLGGVVWFTEFRDKDSSSAASAKPSDKPELTVLKFEENDTRRMEVVKGDRRMVADRNEQGEWTLQPSGQPGDRTRLSGILFRLSTLNATRKVADAPENLTQFGLDNPGLSVTVTLADGTTVGLLAGAKTPTDTGNYVKKPDDPAVYLVTASLVSDLEKLTAEPPVAPPTPTPLPAPTATPGG